MSQLLTPNWARPSGKPWKWRDLFDSASDEVFNRFYRSGFQDASSARFLKLTLAIAQELIDDHGLIDLKQLDALHLQLADAQCPLKATATGEYWRMGHLLRVLEWLRDPEIRSLFEKISKGTGLHGLDHFIQLTLRSWPGCESLGAQQITLRHTRVALLCAWMTYLRQAVGSCFATAPAFLVLTQQPKMFLLDMQQLFSKGVLKRVVDGREFAVPAAEEIGIADLRKKVWPRASILESPGLMWSLESAGLIQLTGDFNADIAAFSAKLRPLVEILVSQEGWVTLEGLLEAWVCRHYGLAHSVLKEHQGLPGAVIASGSLQLISQTHSSMIEQAMQAIKKASQSLCLWTDSPLLRMWEFTLASFSDTRQDYCLWSLHTSLGMNYDQPGSLAQRLYQILQDKVAEYNEKSSELQPQLEAMSYQLQHIMSRLQGAKSDHELTWLRVEHQNAKASLDQLQSERDFYHQKAGAFAELYNSLLQLYIDYFGRYFQQVYDPQMRGAQVGPYDDSPAGFRLVFKAGRTQASSWTSIHSSSQYIDSLARFLVVTEQEMWEDERVAPIRDDFSHIVTLLVQHIRSREFLKSAMQRMAHGLSIPVDVSSDEAIEKSSVTPWAYVSGGTMKALVSHYYGRSESAQEKQSWFHDLRELWVFLIDIMRDMDNQQSERFVEDPRRCLLMHSRTHAFLFMPGHSTFVPCWKSSMYPYTWIRDFYEQQVRDVYSGCLLDGQAQQILFSKYLQEGGISMAFTSTRARLRPHEFRKEFVRLLLQSGTTAAAGAGLAGFGPATLAGGLGPRAVSQAIEILDGVLLRSLPILDQATLLRRAQEFVDQSSLLLVGERKKLSYNWLDRIKEMGPQIAADDLLDSFYLAYRSGLKGEPICGSTPVPIELRQELSRFGLGLPYPVFFADSNWDHYHFAFVLNPGSDQLELWRLEPDSLRGFPMSDWKEQFHETASQNIWGVYHVPQEYL